HLLHADRPPRPARPRRDGCQRLLLGAGGEALEARPRALRQPRRGGGALLALRGPGLDLSLPDPLSALGCSVSNRETRMDHSDVAAIQRQTKIYIAVFAALAVLTVVTVTASYLHLSTGVAIALALFIATVKGSLVAAYFMHLIDERKAIYAILLLTVAFF